MRMCAAVAFAAVLLAPAAAWACPVCGRGAPESEGAYLFMSGVLSALPLLMAAGIGAWVVSRVRARDSADDGDEPRG